LFLEFKFEFLLNMEFSIPSNLLYSIWTFAVGKPIMYSSRTQPAYESGFESHKDAFRMINTSPVGDA